MGEPWFGVKRYGLGIGPRSPAGWIATGVFAFVLVAVTNGVALLHGPPMLALGLALLLGAAFIALAIAKSDHKPWRWRWGGGD